jgi:hypothetical protein
MKRVLAVIAVELAVLAAVGCAAPARTESTSASPPAVSDGQVQTLRERAAAYWAARMAGDDKGQWELLEPRGKGRLTPQEYTAGKKSIRYLGYQVEDATIEGYFATVKIRLLFQAILPRMTSVPVQTVLMDDQWIRVGGAWYRQLEDGQRQRREP